MENDLIKFLQDIVRIPSVCGHEEQVVQRIEAEMKAIGYEEIVIDEFGNLLGRIGNGSSILAIDGHCDTVEVGKPDNWTVDPFGARLRDGMMYGRGACDQKGGLAAAVHAGKLLLETGFPDDVTLWVVASIMEEDCEGLPWKYIIEKDGLKPDAVLLTEPTNLVINRGQRGRLELKVKTSGISSHGSAPERGVNAIYKMAPIIREIESLHNNLISNSFLGKGSVTISDIRSGSPSLCAVADSCTIHLDRRLTEGETIETSLEEIRNLPSFGDAEVWVPEFKVPSYKGTRFPMKSYFPTWALPEDHPLVKTAVQSYRNLFVREPVVDKWVFSTNGVATMGMYQIPSIGFGPGEERFAHAPDERIPLDHLTKALAFYAEFVRNY